MKRYSTFIFAVALSACAGPKAQSDIFAKSSPDMQKVESECADKTSDEHNTHVAAVNCRFDAYEVILGERGFEEYNDLDTLKKHFLSIAKQQDAHRITDAKAFAISEQYIQEFSEQLNHHDSVKSQGYDLQQRITQQKIQMIVLGLSSGLQAYSNARYPASASTYEPSCPACQQGIAQSQQFINNEQQQQQQQMEAQQQQQQINQFNSWSPAHRLWGSSYIGP